MVLCKAETQIPWQFDIEGGDLNSITKVDGHTVILWAVILAESLRVAGDIYHPISFSAHQDGGKRNERSVIYKNRQYILTIYSGISSKIHSTS